MLVRAGPCTPQCPVDSRPRDSEHFGQIPNRVISRGMHAAQFRLLLLREPGLPAPQFPPCPGNRHALPGTHPDQVRLELGKGGQDVEEQLPHGVGGIMDRLSRGKLHALVFQLGRNAARIGNRPGEAVQLGHDQGVAFAHRGQHLFQAGPAAAGAGESLVGMDAIGRHIEVAQRLDLRGQVLSGRGTARVADAGCLRARECTDRGPPVQIKSYHSCETLPAPVFRRFRSRRRGVRMTVPLRTSAHGGTTGRPGDLRHPIRPCGDAQGVGNMGRIIRPECGLHEDGDGFSGFRMPGRGG